MVIIFYYKKYVFLPFGWITQSYLTTKLKFSHVTNLSYSYVSIDKKCVHLWFTEFYATFKIMNFSLSLKNFNFMTACTPCCCCCWLKKRFNHFANLFIHVFTNSLGLKKAMFILIPKRKRENTFSICYFDLLFRVIM